MTYVAITLLVLLFLNFYTTRTSQELFFNSKQTAMVERCKLAATEFSTLEVFSPATVSSAVEQLGSLRVSRLLVTDQSGTVIYDSLTGDSALGKTALLPEIVTALRGKDVFELSDVAFAIVETNGSVSVLKKFPRDTPCNEDLHIEPPTAKQPSLPLLVDGVLNPVNMRLYSVDADWIDAQCRNAGLARKDVLLFLCNDAKETSIVKKESR